jgi:AbrB family looped-hinge helix DNA binding protein
MRAVVAERGQVTIPKSLRDRLGIVSGTQLDFTEEDGRLVAEKADDNDALDRVYGRLGRGRKTESVLKPLRG